MIARFSLHKTRKDRECDLCGVIIPARVAPDYAEYWAVKGGESGTPRTICCMCHALLDLPTDGWEESPDGREIMSAAEPQKKAVAHHLRTDHI